MIYIASDHGGFTMKTALIEYLKKAGKEYVDDGPDTYVSGDDYTDYAIKVCEKMTKSDIGVLLCDTGIGMSIAANRYHHIRAALCSSIFDALRAKEHNNANILVIGSETNDLNTAETLLKVFLETPFSGDERHIRRLTKIDQITDI